MQDASLLKDLLAPLILLVFSAGFGEMKLRYLGFGFLGLLSRQIDYEERRRTDIGMKAHRPLLMRHAESPWYLFSRTTLLLLFLNGAILLALDSMGAYAWAPIIALPLAIIEFGIGRWIQNTHVPMYQADYDNYMWLTQSDHHSFDGYIVDPGTDVSKLVSGGRIIQMSRIQSNGRVEWRHLFVSFETEQRFPISRLGSQRIRCFYRIKVPQDIVADGEFIGFQSEAEPVPDPSYEELEQHLSTKY